MSRTGMMKKMTMPYSQATIIKKGYKKQFKGRCGYCGEFGHKAADCPDKESNQNKGFKGKTSQKMDAKDQKGTQLKGTYRYVQDKVF